MKNMKGSFSGKINRGIVWWISLVTIQIIYLEKHKSEWKNFLQYWILIKTMKNISGKFNEVIIWWVDQMNLPFIWFDCYILVLDLNIIRKNLGETILHGKIASFVNEKKKEKRKIEGRAKKRVETKDSIMPKTCRSTQTN